MFSSATIILVLLALGGVAIMMCLLLTRKVERAGRRVWRTSTIGSTLLTLVVVSVLVVLRFHFSSAVDANAFAMVRTGMTEQDVLNLLGEPSGKTAVTREEAMRGVATWEHKVRSIWKYKKDGVFEFVEVYFDDGGKVVFKHRDY